MRWWGIFGLLVGGCFGLGIGWLLWWIVMLLGFWVCVSGKVLWSVRLGVGWYVGGRREWLVCGVCLVVGVL